MDKYSLTLPKTIPAFSAWEIIYLVSSQPSLHILQYVPWGALVKLKLWMAGLIDKYLLHMYQKKNGKITGNANEKMKLLGKRKAKCVIMT